MKITLKTFATQIWNANQKGNSKLNNLRPHLKQNRVHWKSCVAVRVAECLDRQIQKCLKQLNLTVKHCLTTLQMLLSLFILTHNIPQTSSDCVMCNSLYSNTFQIQNKQFVLNCSLLQLIGMVLSKYNFLHWGFLIPFKFHSIAMYSGIWSCVLELDYIINVHKIDF
ncbi:Hypothetical_protein [Hexamita inflata]|uniref:Hypothetical_protein n=1 Tax=Hexamita inflata TaxID=28002 RepID=A0AA86V4M4_9EUKA|nr:Hypothetical protein HINF_LOCUS44313 [Hexamita inflata]